MRITEKKTANVGRRVIMCTVAATLATAVTACTSVELEQKVFPLFCAVKAEGDSCQMLYEPFAEQKMVDYNHIKVMVFEEAFLENTAAYEQLLTDVQEEDTYPRNAYVCVTEDARKLTNLPDVSAADIGEYLEELLEKNVAAYGDSQNSAAGTGTAQHIRELPTIGQLVDEKENRRKTLYLPYLTVYEDSVAWDGEYCIEKSVPQGVVTDTAENPASTDTTENPASTDSTENPASTDSTENPVTTDSTENPASTDTTEITVTTDTAQTDPLQPQIAKKILRFHVLANSDSEDDQAVKLKVRDAVGTIMQEKLENADSLSTSKQIVSDNLELIRQTAQETLQKEGYSYGVTASLSTVEFPEKTYGAFTFPAGEYEALEVVLGEGEGHNWWCVLYPNLCFRGSMYEVVDEESEKELREVLTPEEYADVFNSGHFEIRLKFLEHFRKNS
jgi:stage II sporulation protein R